MVTSVFSLKQAILDGFARDGSLYLPKKLPHFDPRDFRGLSFLDVAIKMGKQLFPEFDSEAIAKEAFIFPLPIVNIGPYTALELFHGPTLSFKDVGARYMAALTRRFEEKLTILVATTGDTGSAVGDAFQGQANAHVYILFPKGKVTPSQEKQLTTIGGNVTALEIDGTFEQCQQMVKSACQLPGITTANSINIARLFPQAFYFFYAAVHNSDQAVFSVPCGNYGHLVSGLIAKKMGAPIKRFLIATNINDVVPRYLKTGVFSPAPSKQTIAVSMDVGNPSNFSRLLALFDNSHEKMQKEIKGFSYHDDQIRTAIHQVHDQTGYLLDPHSAIAYLALKEGCHIDEQGHLCITAHPSKFETVIPGQPIPERLQNALQKPSHKVTLTADLKEFLKFLGDG